MSDDITEEFSAEEPSRRAFITRYGGMAFAAPVIASFALDGIASGKKHDRHDRHGEDHHPGHPKHGYPNQTHPNQGYPNQCLPNQSLPNQSLPDSSV